MTKPPRFLVIRRRYLGDIVLLGPVFRNLRLNWPEAHLTALVEPAYAPVLTMNPEVNKTLTLPRRTAEWPGFLRQLIKGKFTCVLDLDNNDRTALIARLTGAPTRVALWHEGTSARWRSFYTAAVRDPAELHEHRSIVDYYLAILAAINVPIVSRKVQLVPRPDDLEAAKKLGPHGIRKLLIHPGSRSPWRIWPAENFATLCDRLRDELGVQVVVVGGPGEQALVAEIKRRARSPIVTIDSSLGVPQFAALAAQFSVMLCHDSGPMHLAAAVGTRIIALLGSQNPVLFAPAGEGHIVLRPPLPCLACVSPDTCLPGDSYHNYCVQNLTIERVFDAVRSFFPAENP
jgi:ADP-heptose:LPS heptosyltransferase